MLVQPIGQRVALLPQHRQEQLVLGFEVTIERPRRHPGALQDRGNRDRTAVRLRQTDVGGIDDAAAVVVAGRFGLHAADSRDAAGRRAEDRRKLSAG